MEAQEGRMNHRPRCPRCECRDTEPCDAVLEASDRSEDVKSTHRCLNPKCREPFKDVPPLTHRIEVHPAIAERLWGIK